MKCKTLLLSIICFLALVTGAYAQQSVYEDSVYIESDKETYFCEPVISPDGCLIKANILVRNDRLSAINARFDFDSNKDIAIRDYRNRGQSIAVDSSRGKSIRSSSLFQISSGDAESIALEFYAKEDGKFDFSVFFAGTTVRLDPFFNITYNTSIPSIHLSNGTNNTISDSQYGNLVEITNELSDNSDMTKFQTRDLIPSVGHWRFEEGSGINATDSSGNNLHGNITGAIYISSKGANATENFALQFDGSSDFIQIENNAITQVTGNAISMATWLYPNDTALQANFPEYFENLQSNNGYQLFTAKSNQKFTFKLGFSGSQNTLTSNSNWTPNQWQHIAAVYNGTHMAIFLNGVLDASKTETRSITASGQGFLHLGGELAGTKFEGLLDEMIIADTAWTAQEVMDIYNQGINGSSAIRSTFNLALDNTDDYYLMTRKTTPGIDSVSVYHYQDNNSIDQATLDTHTITTGWDIIPLVNSIVNNSNASFRFFTSAYSEFSEVQLIVGINDSQLPAISQESINMTSLACNSSVRLQANATDDNFIDQVFFFYTDNAGNNIEEADRIIDTDIFFVDESYTHTTTGTEIYNFTKINATDIAGNFQQSFPDLQFNYTCLGADETPPVIVDVVLQNFSMINKLQENLTINWYCTDDIEVLNITWRIYNSTDTIALGQNLTSGLTNLSIDEVVDLTNIGLGVYEIGHVCHDTSNNQADLALDIIILDFIEEVNLTSPANNTGISLSSGSDGKAGLSYTTSAPAICSLFINNTFNQQQAAGAGLNSFDYQTGYANQTIRWDVSCDVIAFDLEVNSSFHVLDISIIQAPEDEFKVGVCPTASTPLVLMFIFFFVLALAIVIIALSFNLGLVGTIGAVMLIVLAPFIWYCIAVLGFLLAMMGIALLFTFIGRSFF